MGNLFSWIHVLFFGCVFLAFDFCRFCMDSWVRWNTNSSAYEYKL